MTDNACTIDGEQFIQSSMYNLRCYECKHYHHNAKGWEDANSCDAFPDGIPIKILQDDLDHHEPYKGDHGIQFEPLSKDV
ncbi:MAG: hypothetical protein ACXQTE_06050 [Methanosarcinaceae archaeon]